jgi:polar amino acid transport system substrate-binding protein
MKRFLAAVATGIAISAVPAGAQTCGGTYTVAPGDSLSLISDVLYKDAGKWTAIHQANIGAIGEDPNAIGVGQQLSISCIGGLPTNLTNAAPVVVSAAATRPQRPAAAASSSKIRVVTGDDFAPFSDRSLENGGLLADVVTVALSAAVPEGGFGVHWVNDWSAHLDPLLKQNMADMSFPWGRPDCAGDLGQQRCTDYLYSEPMFEYLVLLFVNKDRPVIFAEDADIEGRTLCRPAGFSTDMLDQNGRNWVRGGKVTLKTPRTVAACFQMLVAGEVDAVVINEFTGRAAIKDLGLGAGVDVVQGRPISITGLHVVIAKDNAQADDLLQTVNTGLARIQASGQYQSIVNVHMSRIWAEF